MTEPNEHPPDLTVDYPFPPIPRCPNCDEPDHHSINVCIANLRHRIERLERSGKN